MIPGRKITTAAHARAVGLLEIDKRHRRPSTPCDLKQPIGTKWSLPSARQCLCHAADGGCSVIASNCYLLVVPFLRSNCELPGHDELQADHRVTCNSCAIASNSSTGPMAIPAECAFMYFIPTQLRLEKYCYNRRLTLRSVVPAAHQES